MADNLGHEVGAEELASQFGRGIPPNLQGNWQNAELVVEAHRILARSALAKVPPFPDSMHGRGIVICAGAGRLFANAWVCLRMLRRAGCDLPIQFWHLGESEMDERMRQLVAEYNVECVDAEQVRELFPARILNGWELKPYAIVHSPFRQVILLDADNVPLCNPEFLLDTPQFQEHGAIFWPDFGRLEQSRTIWHVCDVDYRDEPEFESGQLVVDKERCWAALNLTMHYNEHSDFYYLHVHGDKETFHLAFHRVGKSYAMPSRGIDALDATMCQHDFEGRRIFQHRNMDKWHYNGSNRRIRGFIDEDACRQFLADLRDRWNGRILWNDSPTTFEDFIIKRVAGNLFDYVRVGVDSREVELRADRTIGRGSERMERAWTVLTVGGQISLVLHGEDSPTCRLVLKDGKWHGRWYRFERMPIILAPVSGNGRPRDGADSFFVDAVADGSPELTESRVQIAGK